MKLRLPRQRKYTWELPARWVWPLRLLVLGLAFLAGMLFYRAGYAERITMFLRQAPQSEPVLQAVEEIQSGLENETLLYQSNGLPNIFLDVPFDAMLKLQAKRDEAVQIGVLYTTDEDFVPGTLRYNDGQTLDIKLRLKGDWADHLRSDKWSFRVHVTEADGAVLGMRRFSLQAPHTRSYVSEWVFIQNLLQEGILTTRYHFVNVILNGDYKGIYALEESFHTDLMESQQRREGVIVRFEDDLIWYDWPQIANNDDGIGSFWLVDQPLNNPISAFRQNHVLSDPALAEEFEAARNLLYSLYRGDLPLDQVLDEELWGRYFALVDLWAAGHSTEWVNLRFYYNPITGLLEPVVYDSLVFHPSYVRPRMGFPFMDNLLFQSPGIQKAYVETLERITQPEYIEALQQQYEQPVGRLFALLEQEYADPALHGNEVAGPPMILPWDTLALRADRLHKNLHPLQPLRGYYHLSPAAEGDALQLDVLNLMPLNLQVESVVVAGQEIPFDPAWCVDEACRQDAVEVSDGTLLLEGRSRPGRYVPYRIPLYALPPLEDGYSVQVKARIYGGTELFTVPLYPATPPQDVYSGARPQITLEQALAQHPFLLETGEGQLAVISGDWDVQGDLVIPRGYALKILPGTTLRFEPGAILLVEGRLDIEGQEDAPVTLTAQGDSWGGVVVLNAAQLSTWRYVTVERTGGIDRDGWVLTGGITFYQSDLHLTNAVIGRNNTEDALNVVRASLTMEQVLFQQTPSDAFDGDFVHATIRNCAFRQIGGDAVDVSGSQAEVNDSVFVDIGDKAISAGENSQVTLQALQIEQVNFGVVSKDLSQVSASVLTIDGARVAGLAAYVKKAQYGPATLQAEETEILNTDTPALAQTESEIVWNGEPVPTQDVDVDALYSPGGGP